MASRSLKAALGWDGTSAPVGACVCLKALTGRHLHTWHGLIGYCLKDEGLPHFNLHLKAISDEDMELGRAEYEKLGAGPLKNKLMLNPHNVISKALNFQQFHYKGNRNGATFPRTLRQMLRTGKFYPAATWVIPYGGKGLSYPRMAALWSMLLNPAGTTEDMVHQVFFSTGGLPPSSANRYFSEFAAKDAGAMEWFDGSDDEGAPPAPAAAAAAAAAAAPTQGATAAPTSTDDALDGDMGYVTSLVATMMDTADADMTADLQCMMASLKKTASPAAAAATVASPVASAGVAGECVPIGTANGHEVFLDRSKGKQRIAEPLYDVLELPSSLVYDTTGPSPSCIRLRVPLTPPAVAAPAPAAAEVDMGTTSPADAQQVQYITNMLQSAIDTANGDVANDMMAMLESLKK